MAIQSIWENDLEIFMKILKEVEEEEEADRIAMGGVQNEGGKGKKKRVANKKKDGGVPVAKGGKDDKKLAVMKSKANINADQKMK
jgi:hypothetical protein